MNRRGAPAVPRQSSTAAVPWKIRGGVSGGTPAPARRNVGAPTRHPSRHARDEDDDTDDSDEDDEDEMSEEEGVDARAFLRSSVRGGGARHAQVADDSDSDDDDDDDDDDEDDDDSAMEDDDSGDGGSSGDDDEDGGEGDDLDYGSDDGEHDAEERELRSTNIGALLAASRSRQPQPPVVRAASAAAASSSGSSSIGAALRGALASSTASRGGAGGRASVVAGVGSSTMAAGAVAGLKRKAPGAGARDDAAVQRGSSNAKQARRGGAFSDEDDSEQEDAFASSDDASDADRADGHKKKRRSKHAPAEMRADRPVSRFREAIAVPKREVRDPRFEATSGTWNTEHFRQHYKFLDDYRDKEIAALRSAMKVTKSPGERAEMQALLTNLHQQRAEQKQRDALTSAVRGAKKEEAAKVAAGAKAPYFMKKREMKDVAMAHKYKMLEASGQVAVDKALKRRRKKMLAKERKQTHMPARRGATSDY